MIDGVGNRTNLIDARANAVGFGNDLLNRLTNIAYAASDNEKFKYDPVGNLTNYTARSGSNISFVFDAANRLSSKHRVDAYDETAYYGYDLAGRLTNITLVGVGSSTNSRLLFAYDAAGRLTNELSDVGAATFPHTVGYQYDDSGRRSRLTYPDNTYVTYEYNTNGWLTAIKDSGTTAIVTYEYDAAGRRTKRTLENNTLTELEYDAAGQATNIWHRRISGGATNTISQYQYGVVA